jgi:hypothetical protein
MTTRDRDQRDHRRQMLEEQERQLKAKVGRATRKDPDAPTREREKDPPPPEWDQIVGLRKTKIADLVRRAAEILYREAELKKEYAELRDTIIPMLIKAGVKSTMVEGVRTTRVDGHSSKLNKQKLVAKHGTKVLDWLKECTDKTPTTGLKLTLPGDNEEEDEG